MKKIPLTQGKFAVVNDKDFTELSKFRWVAQKARRTWYAWRRAEGLKCIKMHRQIMNPPDDMEIDHKDGDGLNNTRTNLRICTRTQNSMNRPPFSNNTSGFKGVMWNKRAKKWKAQIHISGRSTFLGYYSCIIEAAKAYNKAAFESYGEFAYLNKVKK